jgi:hypothetical protein
MKKTPLYLFFAAVVVAYGIFFGLRFGIPSKLMPQAQVTHIPLGQPQGSKPENPQHGDAAPGEITATSTQLIPPTSDAVREEAEKNPHETPPSLIAFAHEISRRETESRKSPESALSFFAELSDCVAGNNIAQAQALCLTTAHEVADVYPDLLKDRYNALMDSSPEEAKKLTRDLQRLSQ